MSEQVTLARDTKRALGVVGELCEDALRSLEAHGEHGLTNNGADEDDTQQIGQHGRELAQSERADGSAQSTEVLAQAAEKLASVASKEDEIDRPSERLHERELRTVDDVRSLLQQIVTGREQLQYATNQWHAKVKQLLDSNQLSVQSLAAAKEVSKQQANEIKALRTELNDTRRLLSSTESSNNRLERVLRQEREKQEETLSEVHKAQAKLSMAQSENERLSSENKSLRSELRQAHNESNELSKQLQSTRSATRLQKQEQQHQQDELHDEDGTSSRRVSGASSRKSRSSNAGTFRHQREYDEAFPLQEPPDTQRSDVAKGVAAEQSRKQVLSQGDQAQEAELSQQLQSNRTDRFTVASEPVTALEQQQRQSSTPQAGVRSNEQLEQEVDRLGNEVDALKEPNASEKYKRQIATLRVQQAELTSSDHGRMYSEHPICRSVSKQERDRTSEASISDQISKHGLSSSSKELIDATDEVAAAQEKFGNLQRELNNTQANVASLEEKLEQATRERDALKQSVETEQHKSAELREQLADTLTQLRQKERHAEDDSSEGSTHDQAGDSVRQVFEAVEEYAHASVQTLEQQNDHAKQHAYAKGKLDSKQEIMQEAEKATDETMHHAEIASRVQELENEVDNIALLLGSATTQQVRLEQTDEDDGRLAIKLQLICSTLGSVRRTAYKQNEDSIVTRARSRWAFALLGTLPSTTASLRKAHCASRCVHSLLTGFSLGQQQQQTPTALAEMQSNGNSEPREVEESTIESQSHHQHSQRESVADADMRGVEISIPVTLLDDNADQADGIEMLVRTVRRMRSYYCEKLEHLQKRLAMIQKHTQEERQNLLAWIVHLRNALSALSETGDSKPTEKRVVSQWQLGDRKQDFEPQKALDVRPDSVPAQFTPIPARSSPTPACRRRRFEHVSHYSDHEQSKAKQRERTPPLVLSSEEGSGPGDRRGRPSPSYRKEPQHTFKAERLVVRTPELPIRGRATSALG